MTVFYRVTKKKCLKRILRQGLVPQIGELAKGAGGGTVPRVYLFPDMQSMDAALGSWLGL